jgi:tetratricopeptide (TPR) repeat protein
MNTVSRLMSSGQVRKAVPELERLVAAEPNDPRLRLFLAEAHVRAGATEAAIAQLKLAAARYERDGAGMKAMAVHLQTLRLSPTHREALIGLGRHYADLGLQADAAATFGKALAAASAPAERLAVLAAILEGDPDNLADRLRLAEAWAASGHMQEAGREFRAVADALEHKADDTVWARVAERLLYYNPGDVAHAKRLAGHYLAEKAPQLALPRLRKAWEARPRDVEVLGLLADAFAQLGQSQKAIACLKEMASLYDQSGLASELDDCWQRILAFDPNDRDALSALAGRDSDVAGQTFDLPLGKFEEAYRARRPSGSSPGRSVVAADSDEIGFEGAAENTIVDRAWVPPANAVAGLGLTFAPPTRGPSARPNSGSQPGLRGVESELKELDFYLQTGLLAEAETLLAELGARLGDHPELAKRARRLAEGGAE